MSQYKYFKNDPNGLGRREGWFYPKGRYRGRQRWCRLENQRKINALDKKMKRILKS